MKHLKPMLLFGSMLLTAALVAGQTAGPAARKAVHKNVAHETNPDRGERVFRQNCSRCHNAPEGFPQSVSSTIATHMRVRANLSEADYKALLQYLNP